METGDECAVKREEILTTFKAEELLLSPIEAGAPEGAPASLLTEVLI
jgi:hypothetical protein